MTKPSTVKQQQRQRPGPLSDSEYGSTSDVDTDDHIRIPITSSLLDEGLTRLGEAWRQYRTTSHA